VTVLLDFEEHTLSSQQQDIQVALDGRSYLKIPVNQLWAGKDPKSVFRFAELLVGATNTSFNPIRISC
jgi:hypothetical protein